MNNDDFTRDPIFAALREFSSQDFPSQMPVKVRTAFREGFAVARKRTFWFRGTLGAGLLVISFPTLSAARILPSPVQHFVERVNRTITAPVQGLFKQSSALAVTVAKQHPTTTPVVTPPAPASVITNDEKNPPLRPVVHTAVKEAESEDQEVVVDDDIPVRIPREAQNVAAIQPEPEQTQVPSPVPAPPPSLPPQVHDGESKEHKERDEQRSEKKDEKKESRESKQEDRHREKEKTTHGG